MRVGWIAEQGRIDMAAATAFHRHRSLWHSNHHPPPHSFSLLRGYAHALQCRGRSACRGFLNCGIICISREPAVAPAPLRSLSSNSPTWDILPRAGCFSGRNIVTKVKSDYVDVGDDDSRDAVLSEELVSGDRPFSLTALVGPFLFPALGGVLFGYDIGVTSGAVLSLTSTQLSGMSWFSLSSIETGLVVSGSLYGALLGTILAFNVADVLGRRKELVLASVTYALGALLTSLAPNLSLLVTGRLLFGVGIGLAMHAAPMYISETAPSQIRGTMISLKEGFIVAGILLGYCVGSLEIGIVGGWRTMYGSSIPIAITMGLGMLWLPSSPRWLLLRAAQGKAALEEAKEKALAAFKRLRGEIIDESSILAEMDETWKSCDAAAGGQQEITFSEIFQGKSNQKAFAIGGGLVFLQQVTGQPSVLYYAAQILQSAGFSDAADATKVAVVLGAFKLLLTGVAIFFVDKLGRRPLLIAGVSGVVGSLLLLAAYYSFASGIPIIAVIALLLYVGSYQVSFGPISWLIVSEVFPLRSRGRAIGLTTLINFASNAVVTFAFAPIQDLMGPAATFLLFALIGIGALAFVIGTVPETKGLTLEEIEAMLSS